jgi:hypothetical protein
MVFASGDWQVIIPFPLIQKVLGKILRKLWNTGESQKNSPIDSIIGLMVF